MKTAAALSAIVALAQAHSTWQQLWKNGEDLESSCARLPPSNSPIEDYTSTALQCNVNPAAAKGKCSYAAGDTVTIEMHQHNSRACTEEGIGGAHWGPVLAYMGKVEDAATADGSGEFFKIYENGWAKAPGSTQGDNDFWGTKDLNYNCGKLDFKIPSDIAPGDYLLRAEAIALHAASSSGGAQHYVTCYQLTVTGSGTVVPKGVKFPEAYSKTGPGLGFSIHAPLTSYPMPGPDLISSGTSATPQLLTFGKISGSPATGGGSKPVSSAATAPASSKAPVVPALSAVPSSASPVASSSAVVEVASSAAPSKTSAVPKPEQPAATPAPPAATITNVYSAKPVPTTLATSARPVPTQGSGSTVGIKEWQQCGGNGFTTAGSCAEGLICKEWNPYYSQCIKDEGAPSNGGNSGNTPPPVPSATIPEPSSVAPEASKPTATGSAEKTYTLKTFIAWLEQEAGSASAQQIRRMIEALQ